MAKEKPLVSVTVPVYNQAESVAETLLAIFNQKTSFNFEVIIGDDASADDSVKVIKSTIQNFGDRATLIEHKTNQGVVKNYKTLMDNCRGKYIAGCGGDDIWHNPDKLQKQVDFLENNPEYGLVHTEYDKQFGNGKTERNVLGKFRNGLPEPHNYFNSLLKINMISAPSVCFRKELFDNYADFDQYIKNDFAMEDLPMWLDYSKVSKFHFFKESMITYRVPGNSISNNVDYDKAFAFFKASYKTRYYFMNKYASDKKTVNEIRKDYHKMALYYSYKTRNRKSAKESYRYLNRRCRFNTDLFMLFGSGNLFFYRISQLYFKFFSFS